jgi:hypothetical protein
MLGGSKCDVTEQTTFAKAQQVKLGTEQTVVV